MLKAQQARENFLESCSLGKERLVNSLCSWQATLGIREVVSSTCTALLLTECAVCVNWSSRGKAQQLLSKDTFTPLGINVFQSLFDLNIKMRFSEKLLTGLVTALHNLQRKETAWFSGEGSTNNPTLSAWNSSRTQAERPRCLTIKEAT